jgi:serine/threonine protein kinase
MPCLRENTMAAFLAGRLDGTALDGVEAHLDRCIDCHLALAAVAAAGTDAQAPVRGEAARSFPPGTRLGRYVIEGALGRGAMGIVYAARDEVLRRRVAIKLPALRRGPAVDRFRREAQAMARLAHRNVVTVYGVGALPGSDGVYIAMELIAGVTARRYVDDGAVHWRSALHVFLEAGEGLCAAHDAGLVHRDFKPDNVLVGDDSRVCVSDFGLAEVARLARPGLVAGSPAYMAPEQIRGGPADARTDVFAFSVSIYEALYGIRPFAGNTLTALEDAIRAGRLNQPARRDELTGAVRDAIVRGLRERPEERPHLRDLVAELRRASLSKPCGALIGRS